MGRQRVKFLTHEGSKIDLRQSKSSPMIDSGRVKNLREVSKISRPILMILRDVSNFYTNFDPFLIETDLGYFSMYYKYRL